MASIEGPIRFASFNASLNRGAEGQLITDLSTPDNAQAKAVAEIIQRNNPDIVLINEFDFDEDDTAAQLFQDNYLSVSQNGVEPVNYQYRYIAPSNTGVASGFDLDNNGSVVTTPGELGYGNDALGFGDFPGQFGMALYSKYEIDTENIRTFQNFLWKDMPGALLPDNPNTPEPNDWYSSEELNAFRLSSKSHWDIPIKVNGEVIHVLASHPTPPVFDDPPTFPEGVDFNGRRNHDEIRFWADYITPGKGSYIYDDAGNFGGLADGSRFVIMGDQNADPLDGDSTNDAILQLLDNPLINTSVTPDSEGGPDAADRQGGANETHEGNPAFDTADFADTTPGNVRADYVLPSQNLAIADAAVFWPTDEDPLFPLVGNFDPNLPPTGFPSSDHRLVRADVVAEPILPDIDRRTVGNVDFLGEVIFDTGFIFNNTIVGGLSGITYDPSNKVYYSISDDRSQIQPARFYTLDINLSDGALENGDITFQAVTTLTDENGSPFIPASLDPEGIALTNRGTLFISSEGDASQLINPFVNQFSLQGQQFQELPVPDKFLPTADGSSGIRNNLAFESLTITPDQRFLFTATENALAQDGPAAGVDQESLSRIIKYDLSTGQPVQEFVYVTDPVTVESVPADAFETNGLVELLALDNTGTLLSLERSFSEGVGNSIKLYQVQTQGALDVSSVDSLDGLEIDPAAEKRLLLDFADLDLPLDNIEGVSFGPKLSDGRQSLIVVSDNNFNVGDPNNPSDDQFTQFLAFGLDINTIPAVTPTIETPQVIDDDENLPTGTIAGDADDPAIYVHPTNSSKSLVISSLKDGGLATYNLKGQLVQSILPADFGDIRYNNVDLVYGFNLGAQSIDLAVASDRENDTLAIFQVDPTTRQLTDITADNMIASIFGVDDGEQTAYGLATYTSPVTGTPYVFVSQREGNQVAQLELVANDTGQVDARLVRTLTVPIPAGGELEDAQVEGMVADRELGFLYVGQEQGGIFKFAAEPNDGDTGVLIEAVKPDGSRLEADVEGLTIYYAEDGRGYLLASSQGDSTFAAYDRAGNNQFLGSFVVGESGSTDAVEESDGTDVINVPLGSQFPFGLVVVQDGANEPQVVIQDDEELENISTNFKFVPWEKVANAFPDQLAITPGSFDPRNPTPQSLINGVASGDTTQASTVLWTRSTFLGDVTFEYSTDPDFNQILGTMTAEVSNPLQPVKVRVKNLTPGTDYFYRVTDAAGATAEGQFNTAAATGAYAGLRFGVSGDWRGELSPYPAIANADQRNLDFFVEHGDTIYADIESPALPGVEQARTLAEYRTKHSEVYGDRFGQNTWSDLRASTSILATIDDHEVINDFAGGAPAASDPRFNTTSGLINDTQLYRNGLRAFQEYNPLRNEFYGETGDSRTAGERQLYRFNTYGSDAAAFILDARSFRDAELPPVTDPNNSAQVAEFFNRSFDPSRTFLGEPQLADLKQDLLQAQRNGITWKFLHIPEPIQNLGPLAASDRYEGYAAERTELLRFIDKNAISNVVFVAADVHGTVVNNLTYQERPFGPQIATSAFEITTGSVAFDAPFGPTVVDLATDVGLLTPEQRASYDSLPVANDGDSLVNDKDDFFKQLVNGGITPAPLGYDPLGLNNNLPVANGLIDATLLQGDYVAAHTYGWTEFDIDPATQQLRVTTYGVEPYTETELTTNPEDIISRTPTIVSQFEVDPSLPKSMLGAIALSPIGTHETGVFDQGAAEIVAYNSDTQRLFVVNANNAQVDVLDVSDPTNPTKTFGIDATPYGAVANSVAVNNGIVAVAVENEDTQAQGAVAFFDLNGNFLSSVRVGALPDMLTFTPDGQKVLVANEGEPSDDYTRDPRGSVSIIDISGGVADLRQSDVKTAGFRAFNRQKTALVQDGLRVFGPNASVAQDLEPEYITVSKDSTTAWIALQENNALGVLDLDSGKITDIMPLGFKDHSALGNGLDTSDSDGVIKIQTKPILGMYQPDGIASYEVNGETFIITTNEGDGRDYDSFSEEESVSDLVLDPTAFPNAADLQTDEALGALTVTTANGDTDGDGDFDQLYAFGGRSFSIWDTQGNLVHDSGDDFEQITASLLPQAFNSDNTENNSFDSRSDAKGPEPEGVTTGVINDRTYAFIGLERIGGVMVYDVTDPASPTFVQYVNNRDFSVEFDPESAESGESDAWREAGDLGPEGLTFIAAKDSPNGNPLLAVANEVSGTTNLFEIANLLNGSNGQNTIAVSAGNGTYTITDFGGVGTGANPSSGTNAQVDTLKFTGEKLTAEKMLLTQANSDLALEFEGIPDFKVTLKDFHLEDLDNLRKSTGASVDIGNILFDGQDQIQDSFDVANANQNLTRVFNRNTTTFLSDLDDNTKGQNGSKDVINGQGGDDTLAGLSGRDILRGGDGDDILTGGAGVDQFWIASSDLPQGTDTITDFEVGTDIIGIAGLPGVTAIGDLSITQSGTDAVINALNKDLATLTGVQANTLDSNSFVFA